MTEHSVIDSDIHVFSHCSAQVGFEYTHDQGGKVKVKVTFTLERTTKTQKGVEVYSSTLSLTSALEKVGVQLHAPTVLPPGKTR